MNNSGSSQPKVEVADFHCDVLSRLLEHPETDFLKGGPLDASGERLKSGGVVLQCFAIYLSQKWGIPKFELILGQIERFRRQVLEQGGVKHLRWREEVEKIGHTPGNNTLWGLLSIEGAEGLEGNLFYAEAAFDLGVRLLGLTWNYANWAADGVLEQRNGGLTNKGRKLVEWCNQKGMLLDVSHLSEAGFWELAELAARPFIASHSNAKAVCGHVRNLTDEQIRAIISMDGRMGLTFFPPFVSEQGTAAIPDLLKHVEHVCSLGGEKQLMFGSDFDGIDAWVEGLEHPGCYPALTDQLLAHYPEELVRGWMYGNAFTFLHKNLPAAP